MTLFTRLPDYLVLNPRTDGGGLKTRLSVMMQQEMLNGVKIIQPNLTSRKG